MPGEHDVWQSGEAGGQLRMQFSVAGRSSLPRLGRERRRPSLGILDQPGELVHCPYAFSTAGLPWRRNVTNPQQDSLLPPAGRGACWTEAERPSP